MTDQIHDLSTWDNVAPRTYTGRMICFPFDDNARKNQSGSAQTLLNSLRNSLDVLVKQRPDFAGKFQLGANLTRAEKQSVAKYKDGYVYLLTLSNYRIYLRPKYPKELESLYGKVTARNSTEDVKAHGINFDKNFIDYDTLKRSKFPVKPFINEDLTTDLVLGEGKPPIPVVEVEVILLNGGFFFNLLIHHIYFDGKAYHKFLECFAACTRGQKVPQFPSSPMVKLPYEQDRSIVDKKSEDILPLCSDFRTWPDDALKGPTQPIQPDIPNSERPKSFKNDSKIFIFNFSKLKTLSLELARLLPNDNKTRGTAAPSAYTTLCAILWAHTLIARESFLSNTSEPSEAAIHKYFSSHVYPPFFSTPVDWSSTKLLQTYPSLQAPLDNYFGNTVTWAITTLPSTPSTSLLHDIASGNKTSLAQVASSITQSISQISPSHLFHREALFDKAPDMRMLGLPWDSRMPAEWGMNSWADFGADIHWSLPGVAKSPDISTEGMEKGTWTLADAQRRVQKEVGGSGGLILPARRARPREWECQVSLPEGAMRALQGDEVFMGYVEGVVG